MSNVNDISSNNKIDIVTSTENNVTITQPNTTVVQVTGQRGPAGPPGPSGTGADGGFTGSFSGSYIGDGSGLENIPASGIVGLNLSRIASGSVTASVSPGNGFFVNTNITASGDISASSGTFIGLTGSFNHIITDNETIEFRSKELGSKIGSLKFNSTNGLEIQDQLGARAKVRAARGEFLSLEAGPVGMNSLGSITASADVSASGDMMFTNATASNNILIKNNLTVLGTGSFTHFITTYESSSIIYASGSTKFGDTLDDTHARTGSMTITGSLTITGGTLTGDGSGLSSIPASGIVGLNLSQIASGSATASIAPNKGFEVNTNITASGNLRIQTATPTISVQRTNNSNNSSIDFIGQSGFIGSKIQFIGDSNDLTFGTYDGSSVIERLRLEDGTDGKIKIKGGTQITGSTNISGSSHNFIGPTTFDLSAGNLTLANSAGGKIYMSTTYSSEFRVFDVRYNNGNNTGIKLLLNKHSTGAGALEIYHGGTSKYVDLNTNTNYLFANTRFGTNSGTAAATVDVVGNLNITTNITASGTVSASSYIGDGSGLTGVDSIYTADGTVGSGRGVTLTDTLAFSGGTGIGIGATPSYYFEVRAARAATALARVRQTNATGDGLIVRADSTTSTVKVLSVQNNGANQIFNVFADGTSKISGSAQITGSLTVSGSSTPNIILPNAPRNALVISGSTTPTRLLIHNPTLNNYPGYNKGAGIKIESGVSAGSQATLEIAAHGSANGGGNNEQTFIRSNQQITITGADNDAGSHVKLAGSYGGLFLTANTSNTIMHLNSNGGSTPAGIRLGQTSVAYTHIKSTGNAAYVKIGYNDSEDWQDINNTRTIFSGNVSGSTTSTASFGTYLGDGSQLDGIQGFPFSGSAVITGSLTVSASIVDFSNASSVSLPATTVPLINPQVEYFTTTEITSSGTTVPLPGELTFISSSTFEYLEIFINGLRLRYDMDFAPQSTGSVKYFVTLPSGTEVTYKSLNRP